MGRAFTRVDTDRLTPAAVVEAIREGRVEAHVSDWLPHRLVHRLYRAVPSRKGHLDTPDWLGTDEDDAVDEAGTEDVTTRPGTTRSEDVESTGR